MREGLEISEAKISDLERTLRLDSEFFRKEFIKAEAELNTWDKSTLAETSKISDGNHFSISDDFTEGGVPYYRGNDATGRFFIEQSNPVHITQQAFELPHMTRSHLKKGDVLLSIVGTIGALSLVTFNQAATCSCKLAILRPKSIPPEFLAVYLRCRHGNSQIRRYTRGAVQMGLPLADFDQIWVPKFSIFFHEKIKQLVKSSQTALLQNEKQSQAAEQTLLKALGLENWKPPSELYYEAKASLAFEAGRLDSEFFAPKYLQLAEMLKQATSEYTYLSEIIKPLKNGADCRDFVETGLPYIRVGDIKNGQIMLESAKKIDLTHDEIQKDIKLSSGDILLTRKGSFGNAAVVDENSKHAVISSEIILLRLATSKILPQYLATFLNSILGELQAEQFAHGAAFFSISQDDVKKIIIPIPPMSTQESICELLAASQLQETESKNLLTRATRAVEIAIEQGEEAAMDFLQDGRAYAEKQILPRLFAERHYLNTDELRSALDQAGLDFAPDTVKRYVHDWLDEKRFYSAGKGWYSDLKEPLQLPIPDAVKQIAEWMEKAFPLESFRIWSTEQVGSLQQHLPAQHLVFLSLERDAILLVADQLRKDRNLKVIPHPLGDIAKSLWASDWDVILRPLLSEDQDANSPFPSSEHILADLAAESEKLGYMGEFEYESIFSSFKNKFHIQVPRFINRCKTRNTNAFHQLNSLISQNNE